MNKNILGQRGMPGRGPQGQQGPPGAQVQVDLSTADDIACDECGSYRFEHKLFYLKRLSALMSPTGEEGVVPIGPLFVCGDCGHANEEFVPPALRKGSPSPPKQKNQEEGPKFTLLGDE